MFHAAKFLCLFQQVIYKFTQILSSVKLFFIIIVLTLLTSGTCRISHEIGALEVIIDKDRIYMQHLANVAEDNSYPSKERNQFASWYKKWTQAHIPLMVCLFVFCNWDSLHARLNSHYKAWSYKKKKHKKIKAYRKSVQKKPTVKRCLLISH